MIDDTCPFCGSTDWDYEEKIDDSYTDEHWVDWACHCYKCNSDFRRLESYKLTYARHEAFREG